MYGNLNAPSEAIEQARPERALWAAMLLRLIKDASVPDDELRYGDKNKNQPTLAERDRDRYLIETLHQHFVLMCVFVGMDPQAVRDRFMAGKIDNDYLVKINNHLTA